MLMAGWCILQPMKWVNDWPVIGIDKDGDGKGEPVLVYKKPNVGKTYPVATPQESDEFNEPTWASMAMAGKSSDQLGFLFSGKKGVLRMNSVLTPDSAKNLWDVPNLLTQKFPAEEFMATTKFSFNPKTVGEKFGLVVMGMSYAHIAVTKKADGVYISYASCLAADKGTAETEQQISKTTALADLYFRVKIDKGAICTFSYSTDGKSFTRVAEKFTATPGKWIGATFGCLLAGRKKSTMRALLSSIGFAWKNHKININRTIKIGGKFLRLSLSSISGTFA